jgi:His/Glu/Gln/Arg/opine family amino acid ABC transporter permease subunit
MNFIEDNRYMYIFNGLKNTVIITICAVFIGIFIGMFLALIKVSSQYKKSGLLKALNIFADIYLTVIRGTPVVLQLLIMYFIVFASVTAPLPIAILTFGINSGAYVAEIIRSGILAVDFGQTEAGFSLGLSYWQTMFKIVMPQAIKNILPALVNEFITLLKETSVAGYVAIQDLTKGGDIIRSRTYDPYIPLLSVGLIYLVIVIFLTKLLGRIERRLRESDKR